ncbi:MAG: hypothetical protein M3281_05780 [Chloroflexota bacterium]|nr:hypothetical protein [Chloroflexota bacterium]
MGHNHDQEMLAGWLYLENGGRGTGKGGSGCCSGNVLSSCLMLLLLLLVCGACGRLLGS